MGVIYFNGQSSENFGIHVVHPPAYEYAEKDIEIVHVPGRNGDILIDNGGFKNTKRSYEISFGQLDTGQNNFDTFEQQAIKVSNWLQSSRGYCVLKDSYDSSIYRIASYLEGAEISNILRQAGNVKITFNCKPQKFLVDGDTPISYLNITYKDNPILENNTGQIAKPIVIVHGPANTGEEKHKGIVKIGQTIVKILNINRQIIIDSESMNAYTNMLPVASDTRNSDIILENDSFPYLVPGPNTISFPAMDEGTNEITKIEVIPKWWRI